MNHVPADLFDRAGIGEPWQKSAPIARARRLLVTMWLLHPDLAARSTPELTSRARAVWDANVRALNREGRVTIPTVLSMLKEAGFVRSFDTAEGGYVVELVKEAA